MSFKKLFFPEPVLALLVVLFADAHTSIVKVAGHEKTVDFILIELFDLFFSYESVT